MVHIALAIERIRHKGHDLQLGAGVEACPKLHGMKVLLRTQNARVEVRLEAHTAIAQAHEVFVELRHYPKVIATYPTATNITSRGSGHRQKQAKEQKYFFHYRRVYLKGFL